MTETFFSRGSNAPPEPETPPSTSSDFESSPNVPPLSAKQVAAIRGILSEDYYQEPANMPVMDDAEYMRSYTRDGFVLHLFDPNFHHHGRHHVSYQLIDKDWYSDDQTPIFEGAVGVSPQYAIDSDETMVSVLNLICHTEVDEDWDGSNLQRQWLEERSEELAYFAWEWGQLLQQESISSFS